MHPSWLLVTCGICGIDLIWNFVSHGAPLHNPCFDREEKSCFWRCRLSCALTHIAVSWVLSLEDCVCTDFNMGFDLCIACHNEVCNWDSVCQAQWGNRPVQVKPSVFGHGVDDHVWLMNWLVTCMVDHGCLRFEEIVADLVWCLLNLRVVWQLIAHRCGSLMLALVMFEVTLLPALFAAEVGEK